MKFFCVIAAFALFGCALCQVNPNPPSNPCNAFPVVVDSASGNITMYGSTTNQGSFTDSICMPEAGVGGVVWYTITPEAGKSVVISTCGDYTNFDTVLSLYTGSCDNLHCEIKNDDGDCYFNGYSYFTTFAVTTFSSYLNDDINLAYYSSFFGYYDDGDNGFYGDPSTIQFISDGSQYFIAVSGRRGEYGNFDFTVTVGESNSGCMAPKDIHGPYTVPVVVNATIRADETVGISTGSCHTFDFEDNAVWFKIYPELNKKLNITTCSPYTTIDTVLGVLSGSSCSTLHCDYENDDDSIDCFGNYDASGVRFVPTESEYYVVVGAYGGHHVGSSFGLVISQDSNVIDPDCIHSIPLHIGVTGTPTGSTATQGQMLQTPFCSNEAGLAMWFVVSSRTSGSYTFSTCNSHTDFDTVLSVYGGTCSALTCMAQNDDACGSTSSQLTISLNAGASVFLVVSGKNGASGNFQIDITQ